MFRGARKDQDGNSTAGTACSVWVKAALLVGAATALVLWIEAISALRIIHWFGVPLSLALYLLPAAVGIGLIWRRYPRIRARWDELDALHPPDPGDVFAPEVWSQRWRDSLVLGCTVLFLLIPGPLTSVAAFYLLTRTRV